MHPRLSTAPERTSFGMGVVAVAVGVGYGVVDSIARRVHRHDEHTDLRAPTFHSRRTAHAAHSTNGYHHLHA